MSRNVHAALAAALCASAAGEAYLVGGRDLREDWRGRTRYKPQTPEQLEAAKAAKAKADAEARREKYESNRARKAKRRKRRRSK